MRRKTPWHAPSECSFNYGYRIGFLDGRIKVLKDEIERTKNWARSGLIMEFNKLRKKQKAWREGRPR